jgi:hypothetical protein
MADEPRITPEHVDDQEDLYLPRTRAPRGTGPATVKAKENQIKATLRLAIEGANTGVILFEHGLAPYRLTEDEIDALVDSLHDVVKANPAVLKWITKAGKATPYGKLLLVLYTIGVAKAKLYAARQSGSPSLRTVGGTDAKEPTAWDALAHEFGE